jgi:hypothetical protein
MWSSDDDMRRTTAKKGSLLAWIVRGSGEGAPLGPAAIANTLADALAPFYATEGECKEKYRDQYPPV